MVAKPQGVTSVVGVDGGTETACKVTVGLPGQAPPGGVFDTESRVEGFEDWRVAPTHHVGRASVPRHLGDDRAMDEDGEAGTWFER
mgnify:CR=1 FL=1